MIEIIGLIFLGIWAAGKAKQKGKNQYLWSLVPVGLYLTIYLVTYLTLNFGLGMHLSPADKFSLTIVMFIKIALIPLSFILSKFLLERLFRRIPDVNENKNVE
jgi:hypothetical protein